MAYTTADYIAASKGDAQAAARLPMSEWSETRRYLMTPQTVAMNARLHFEARTEGPSGEDDWPETDNPNPGYVWNGSEWI